MQGSIDGDGAEVKQRSSQEDEAAEAEKQP